ncbi:MAG: hypothetical protein ACK4NY_18515 [Spirosomataceae bacterium]
MKKVRILLLIIFICPSISMAQATPKDGVKALLTWLDSGTIPDEGLCYEGEGYEITKIDYRCFEKHLAKIEKTKIFSKVYLASLRNEVIEKNKQIAKQKYAYGLEADRYTLSQDPPTGKQLMAGLPTSVVTTNRNKSTVILKIAKPYKHSIKYLLDLEDGVWRVSAIQPYE